MKPALKIKKISDDVENVSYSREGDAGIDLRASGRFVIDLDSSKKEIEKEELELQPGERILAKTGIEVEVPKGFWGNIRDRSGLAFNHGVHVLAGVVDETYRGEIGIVLVNLGKKPYAIKKNDRIAQMVITPYQTVDILFEEDLQDTRRGRDGFGSSGKK